MSQIIAGIYEIQDQIGAGGGGIVYLGRHLRLEKQIVLKADRRTLTTKSEILRREVDMLKDLSHTYIPQVYDFVQENGVVYTAMDFIEGESLDKLLDRREPISQPQVIRWACQLLEALSYLHGRPPHGILHGDIKPANIIVRPDGDICLIDYNIALALGEDGAVRVGFSRGYASPEHYGLEFVREGDTTASAHRNASRFSKYRRENDGTETMTMGDMKTETDTDAGPDASSASSGGSTVGRRSVKLDVRSDIYSLGATLYHLLSGQRPCQNAAEVAVLGPDVCSPAVSAILQKAMNPDPDLRFQSAKDMLTAFLQLHKKDKRVIRHKRRITAAMTVLAGVFLLGGAGAFVGLKQLEQLQTARALAEYSANQLAVGDVSGAVELALQAIPAGKNMLEAPVTAQAQKALTDALGVYDLSDGFKNLDTLKLPSAPFKIAVSPEGTYVAAVYLKEAVLYETESRRKLVELPLQNSALSDVVFVDNNHIIYAGEKGLTAYDLETQETLWTGGAATTVTLSGDRTLAAVVFRDEDHAAVYRLSDGKKVKDCSFEGRRLPVAVNDIFADPADHIFSLNEEGNLLAVSFSDGSLTVFNLEQEEDDLILYEESGYTHFDGGFCGPYFAFTANKDSESVFGLVDTEKAIYLGGYESNDPMMLQADKNGIYLASGNLLEYFAPDTLEETELAYTAGANITAFAVDGSYVMTATDDNSFSFYDSGANKIASEMCAEGCDFIALSCGYAAVANRSETSVRLLKLESHEEARLLTYDARYRHDEARVSPNTGTAMLFDYQGFRIYDMEGEMRAEVELPDPEHIYDQQFVRDGENAWLEVIWYDGTVRRYRAEDGAPASEIRGEAPREDLYEEFYTKRYRIASSLHGAPEVYDIKTGRLLATLEKDSYLTYVTEVGEYLVTEYISAAGERYGILLNRELETLAYLPKLCDIVDDMLVFDDQSGNLRQCRLYSLQELVALGEAYTKSN
ncbi:WD40 repeat domain-containing serine/threonine protein kinase [Hungatella effluvii]|uniref:WD40 repeat domain-containing serine/threonine protein kinase n=1 Tax=Hungatella effluvii TaxID=1096246 RepID=UPI0022E1B231|nr:WD40 repeat domain-containing serine/threonine protein kinase [Hungatella effluvii]